MANYWVAPIANSGVRGQSFTLLIQFDRETLRPAPLPAGKGGGGRRGGGGGGGLVHHPYSHRVYGGTLYSGAFLEERLYSTSSSTTTSLDSEARLYEEHPTVRCRNIIYAVGQHSLYRPQTSYKSLTSLLTSKSRKGGNPHPKPSKTKKRQQMRIQREGLGDVGPFGPHITRNLPKKQKKTKI